MKQRKSSMRYGSLIPVLALISVAVMMRASAADLAFGLDVEETTCQQTCVVTCLAVGPVVIAIEYQDRGTGTQGYRTMPLTVTKLPKTS